MSIIRAEKSHTAALEQAYARHASEASTIKLRGVSIAVLAGSDDSSNFGLFEYTVEAGTPGPVLHWHKVSTEWFYVIEGEMTFEVSGAQIVAKPQSFVLVPPRTLHRFWNSSTGTSRFLFSFDRPGMEGYFRELLAFAERIEGWPPKTPDQFAELESIAERYDTFAPAKLSTAAE